MLIRRNFYELEERDRARALPDWIEINFGLEFCWLCQAYKTEAQEENAE